MALDPIASTQEEQTDAITAGYHLNLKGKNLFADPCIKNNSVSLQKVAIGQDLQSLEQNFIGAFASKQDITTLQAVDTNLQGQINTNKQAIDTKITLAQANAATQSKLDASFQEIKLTDTETSINIKRTYITNLTGGITVWQITMPSAGFKVIGYYDLPSGGASARRQKKQLADEFTEGAVLELREVGNIANGTRTVAVAKFTALNF